MLFIRMLVFTYLCFFGTTSGLQEPPRDISKYRVIGPFDLGNPHNLNREKESQIRDFLWDSFRKHSLAHVVVTAYSIEGDKSVSSFYVEYDKNGDWRIHVEIKRDLGDRRPGQRGERYKESTSYDAYFVKRVDINSPYMAAKYLDDAKILVGTQYKLEFWDKDQKRITEF